MNIGVAAQIACLLEVTARKAGNVHRECNFADTHLIDFQLSAAAIGPAMSLAAERPVGVTILEAVRATRQWVKCNTNLGIILLLAPLAAVPQGVSLKDGISDVLDNLTIDDAVHAYEAIRLANPGGLGQAPEQDIAHAPTQTLREVMALAADRDLIARQYVDNFKRVFDFGVPRLSHEWRALGWEPAIQLTHLHFMAFEGPDSLIVRKRGLPEALEVARRAAQVINEGFPCAFEGQDAFREFDAWLREHGNARNPGTSADLVTAILFAAIRDQEITVNAGY